MDNGWATFEEICRLHQLRIGHPEPGLLALNVEPHFALGQRALYVDRILFDCVPLLDEESYASIKDEGGLEVIAIYHPHTFGAMLYWAEVFDATVLIHESDRPFIPNLTKRIELWKGESLHISRDFELLRIGGHFPGAAVGLWKAGADGCGALFTSDVLHVAADCESVAFMWSHTNFVPLSERDVVGITAKLQRFRFDRLYGVWWDRVIPSNAKERLIRSGGRHCRAIQGSYAPD